VTVEGIPVIRDVNTPTGKFHENSVEVDVRDGRLTVLLGPQETGMNTTLNWIRVVRLKAAP
jgi:ABC-type branched-subunit amino acid transport system ATPase component